MNKIRAGIKNKIIVVLAVACTAYFVSFWMGTERDVALKAYEKAAEEAMIADTEILAHNGHIRSMDGQDTEIRDLYNDKPVLIYFWMPWSDDSKKGMAVLETYTEGTVTISMSSSFLSAARQKKPGTFIRSMPIPCPFIRAPWLLPMTIMYMKFRNAL